MTPFYCSQKVNNGLMLSQISAKHLPLDLRGEPLMIVGGGSGKSEKKKIVSSPFQEKKNCKCQGAGKIKKQHALFWSAYRRISAHFSRIFDPPELVQIC